MTMLERILRQEEWNAYYQYKEEAGNLPKEKLQDLRRFIDNREYVLPAQSILRGDSFDAPHKTSLNKMHSSKKRIVYTYSREENYILKMLTYLLKEYDSLFCDNLYSFRRNKGVKNAIDDILSVPELDTYYSYKVDISNYFNSIDIKQMLPILEEALIDDVPLYLFLKSLLENEFVYEQGTLIKEEKGIMAGTPISTFLANLYLKDMDAFFREKQCLYARYSDDMIVFGKTKEEIDAYGIAIKEFLMEKGLAINEKKEVYTLAGEKWTFLGFSYEKGRVDVSDISIEKIKKKMRRKVKALQRWQRTNRVSGEKTALAFIRHFNRKFFENKKNGELTWARWYFPIINKTDGLEEIDHFMQEQIRYLATGKRTKARFHMRYEDMKRLGYRSLVNEYYKAFQKGR